MYICCLFILVILLSSFKLYANTLSVSNPLEQCIQQALAESGQSRETLQALSCENVESLDGIGALRNLERLEIRAGKMQTLPAELQKLTKLQSLAIVHSGLSEIPQEVFALRSLQELNVSNNQLYTIPSSISQLTKLRSLHVGGNLLTYVPAAIVQLQNLEELVLSTNRIIVLPELGKMTGLKRLVLDNNQLVTLPDLTNMELDYFSGNKNLLQVKSVATKNKTFPVTNSYRVKPVFYKTVIDVKTEWKNIEETLSASVVINNGITPFGYSSYALVNMKDENGKGTNLDEYVVPHSNKVMKDGKVTAQVQLSNVDGKAIVTVQDPITIQFKTQAVIGDTGNGKQQPVPDPANEETPEPIVTIREQQDETIVVAADGTEQTVTPAPVILVDDTVAADVFTPNWYAFFSDNLDANGKPKWNLFVDGDFLMLSMIFAVVALIPILLFVLIVQKTRNMYGESEQIFVKK